VSRGGDRVLWRTQKTGSRKRKNRVCPARTLAYPTRGGARKGEHARTQKRTLGEAQKTSHGREERPRLVIGNQPFLYRRGQREIRDGKMTGYKSEKDTPERKMKLLSFKDLNGEKGPGTQ